MTPSMREQFEAAMPELVFDKLEHPAHADRYRYDSTHCAWIAWQASAKVSRKAALNEVAELCRKHEDALGVPVSYEVGAEACRIEIERLRDE